MSKKDKRHGQETADRGEGAANAAAPGSGDPVTQPQTAETDGLTTGHEPGVSGPAAAPEAEVLNDAQQGQEAVSALADLENQSAGLADGAAQDGLAQGLSAGEVPGTSDAGEVDAVKAVTAALAAVAEESGCGSVQDLISMARLGNSVMASIATITAQGQLMEGWWPAEDPAEIIGDLVGIAERDRHPPLASRWRDYPDMVMSPRILRCFAAENACMAVQAGSAFPMRIDGKLYDVLDGSPDIPAEALAQFLALPDGMTARPAALEALKATYVGMKPWHEAEDARRAAEEAGPARSGSRYEKSGRTERAGAKVTDATEAARIARNTVA